MRSNLVRFLEIAEYNSMCEAKPRTENLRSNFQYCATKLQTEFHFCEIDYRLGPVGFCQFPTKLLIVILE